MTNINLTVIYPLILGKMKSWQNLFLIISCILLLIVFTLSWFDDKMLSNITVYLLALSGAFIVAFILLSLPFIFFKRKKTASIVNGIMSIEINRQTTDFNTQDLRFLLNIDRKSRENNEPLTSEMFKQVSTWGNYIVIPSESSMKDIYIQFIPDEDLLKVIPELKIETCESKSIIMNDTTELIKKIMWMLWGAS